jgi:hypothetical protein
MPTPNSGRGETSAGPKEKGYHRRLPAVAGFDHPDHGVALVKKRPDSLPYKILEIVDLLA